MKLIMKMKELFMKIKEKIDNFLSGSAPEEEMIETPEVKEHKDTPTEPPASSLDKQLFEDALTQSNLFEDLLDEMWVEKELQEYGAPDVYYLKKPKEGEYHWLVEYRTKMLSPVRYASEVVPLLSLGDDKFVCWVGKAQYIISASLMEYAGEN